jgi:hypothetical protein
MVRESSCDELPGSVAMITAFQIGSSGWADNVAPTWNIEHL